MRDYLLTNDVVELDLNYAKGWVGDDISFLRELPQLLSFMMIEVGLSSLEPIHALHELRCLKLTARCKTGDDATNFRNLRSAQLVALENPRTV